MNAKTWIVTTHQLRERQPITAVTKWHRFFAPDQRSPQHCKTHSAKERRVVSASR
jgi:hypothetical protein